MADLSPAERRVVRAVVGGKKLQFALKEFLPGIKAKTPAYHRIWRVIKAAKREKEQKKGNQHNVCFVVVMLLQNCYSTSWNCSCSCAEAGEPVERATSECG